MNLLITLTKAVIPEKYHPIFGEFYLQLSGYFLSLLLIGSRFCCPCCGRRFRRFLTYGVTPRKNAMCPRCRSLERHRLLWLYLKNKTNLFTSNLKVLHVGPEPIFQKIFKSMPNLDYISADLNSPYAMLNIDVTDIPYEECIFDVILCSHVLEHVEDDGKAIREFHRVLKPGGWAILQVPVSSELEETLEDTEVKTPEERELAFGLKEHVRKYGLDYKDRLENAGFTVNVDQYAESLSTEMVRVFCLNKDENVYFCTKPLKQNQ
jgi:SAM-dependent methyltransferase